MKFEIGNYYQHTTGRVICIIGTARTFFHGDTLLGEDDQGSLIPIGKDEASTINYHRVSGWHRDCYEGNSIPEPSKKPNRVFHGSEGSLRRDEA